MGRENLDLKRAPVDMECANPECENTIPLGTFAYINEDEGTGICLDCAAKRGWTTKQRTKQILTMLELREDTKALKAEQKIMAEAVLMLKGQINLYQLGEHDRELEKQNMALMKKAQEYLDKVATAQEKETFKELQKAIDESKKVQQEIRLNIDQRMYWFNPPQKKKRKNQPIKTET